MTEVPRTYSAAEAGAIIGKSENWMKTQARAGKIPFSRMGRTMRWTPQHLSEILRAGESKPQHVLVPRTPARRRQHAEAAAALQAKQPRRRRDPGGNVTGSAA